MKLKLSNLVLSGFISTLLFVSCESHEKKVDDAFEKVKESKNDPRFILKEAVKAAVKDTVKIIEKSLKDQVKTQVKTQVIIKNETIDEWTEFKAETEIKINASESKIKMLKDKRNFPENKDKFDKQVKALEQKNNDLRKRMNDYGEDVKVKWEKFKVGINHDIDEIGLELKDVKIDNEKSKP